MQERTYRGHTLTIEPKSYGMGLLHRPIHIFGPLCPDGITLCGKASLKWARQTVDDLFNETQQKGK